MLKCRKPNPNIKRPDNKSEVSLPVALLVPFLLRLNYLRSGLDVNPL
jgi:hypothetical protein